MLESQRHELGAWCMRVESWLRLYAEGALVDGSVPLPKVIHLLESEAVRGERLAALLGAGAARQAALGVVARLDFIIVRLSDHLAAVRAEDGTGLRQNESRDQPGSVRRRPEDP